MNYRTFSFLIRTASGSRWVPVLATTLDAARADMAQAFSNLEIITVSIR